MSDNNNKIHEVGQFSRRDILKASGVVAGSMALGSLPIRPVFAAERIIKIGYVSPQTGPLAPFAAADKYIIDSLQQVMKNSITVAGKPYRLEVIVKDSQSNPNRAAEVASELILANKVDLMLVSSTPETTNPVSDQCEINEVPCISTVAPWQPWFFTRGGDPAQGFEWTYHFFWGLEDVIGAYTGMWASLDTNKAVGGLFPNDGDGNAWGDPKLGFPPTLAKKGFKLVDPGRFQSMTDDFSAQISAFKKADSEIVTGVVIPPDLTTFWTQARQQGFQPKAVSVGKALLFPTAVETLGKAGHNLSTEVWWSPTHPFSSSLNGHTASQLAQSFSQATGKQWTQPLGFVHALFELAVDILKRTEEVGNPDAIRDALLKTRLNTVVGPISWSDSPIKNVAKTPLVGGQWRLQSEGKFDLVITSNAPAPAIPVGGEMQPITY
jgi:branched-chain amino acid transport system substrate-binding protein